jgi:phage gp29-like protein
MVRELFNKMINKVVPRQSRPIMNEIAVQTVRDRYASYPSHGLTPERLTRIFKEADQGDVMRQSELFEEMEEKDLHLAGILQTRKLAVIGLEWEILPVSTDKQDKVIAGAAREMIEYIENWENALLDILDAIGKGFSVCEIMWEIAEGKYWVKSIDWVHQKRFTFNSPDVLLKYPRLITDAKPVWGEELSPDKFIVHICHSRSGIAPRGGILRPCAWMFLFKNYDIKSWLVFNELYSVPMRVGKYAPGASASEIETLKQAVFNMATDAAAVISDSTLIEIIESKVTGQTKTFTDLAEFCDKTMSKAVLGHTGSAEGTPGKLGGEDQAKNIRQDLLESDAKTLMKTIKFQLLAPWVRFNYGPDKGVPIFKMHFEGAEDLEKTAKVYGILRQDVGYDRIGIKHIQERFGIPEPAQGEETIGQKQKTENIGQANKVLMINANYSDSLKRLFPDQAAVDAITLPNPGQLDPVTEKIITMIRSGDTYDGIMAEILTSYPSLDISEVENLIRKAIYINDIWGQLNA